MGRNLGGGRWIEFIGLLRPQLFVIPAAAGACGVLLACTNPDDIALALGTLIPVLVWAGGQVFNDYCDAEFDKIYHPEWPIPSGAISKHAAVIYGLSFYLISLTLAFFVTIPCLAACLVTIVLATLYSARLKRKGSYGNVCFGLIVAACILIGATAGGNVSALVIAVMAIATLVHASDNIIGTFPDMDADIKMGFQTLPTQRGLKPAARIAFFLISAASGITMFLWLLGLNKSYLPLAIIACLSLLWTTFSVFKDPVRFSSLGALWVLYSYFMEEILLYMSFIIGVIGA